jgi:hypothetical protein
MPEICEPLSQILVSNFDLRGGGPAIDVVCTSTQSFLVYYCSTNFGGDQAWYMVSVNSAMGGGGTGSNSPVFIVGGVPDDVITFRIHQGATCFFTLQTTCSAKASIYSPDRPGELHPSPLAQPGPPHPHHPTRRATKRARRRGHVSRTK